MLTTHLEIPGALMLSLQPAELTSDNNLIEFSIDDTNWSDSITTQSGDVVQIRWKVVCSRQHLPHGEDTTSTLIGYQIIGGLKYTQTYNYTVG